MQQTNLNIGTIGQRLEAARQAKGVTVSEAGRATKILGKFIEAMESDDFGALSAPVYAKSFIKMYAQYLGIDPRPLVEEYAVQHAPRSKPNLGEEVRQNLAKADQIAPDVGAAAAASTMPKAGKKVFGEVNEAMARLSGTELPWKIILTSVGGVLLLLIVVLSATQCSDDRETEPTTVGGAASVQRAVIADGPPDVYLGPSGQLEVEK